MEPNDVPAGATIMTPGHVLVGSIASPTDLDHFVFHLSSGERFLCEVDSLPAGASLVTRIVSPDGVHLLNGNSTFTTIGVRLAFAAPSDGWYYLRTSSNLAVPGYRIRTMFGDGTGDRGRDVSDIFVSTSEDGETWTAPVMVNSDGFGRDDYLPTIAVGLDGAAYVTWYDYNTDPSGALSRLVVAQSTNGGRRWSEPHYVSSVANDWSTSVGAAYPMGYYSSMFADLDALRMTWTDIRNGTPDVYYAHLPTDFVVLSCPPNAAGNPNSTITTYASVASLNQFFDQTVTWTMQCLNRSWPMTSSLFTIPAHNVVSMPVTINVPDTAQAGTVTMLLRLRQGANLDTCVFNLNINPVAGVEDGPVSFALERVTPNPAPGRATLTFDLPRPGSIRLTIFGLDGRRVREIANGAMPAGRHRIEWDGRDDAGARSRPGAYFVRLEAGELRAARKFVIM